MAMYMGVEESTGPDLAVVSSFPDSTLSKGLRAAEAILKDLQEGTGPVEEGTVIRWTSVHPVNGTEFRYAAVFAGGSWYTTVARDNDNVQKIMDHDDLISYLVRKKQNLKDVGVAIDFTALNW